MYKILNDYLVRTPNLCIQKIEQWNMECIVQDESIDYMLRSASHDLYNALIRYRRHPEGISSRDFTKLAISLYKYHSRICTRCTPFENLSSYAIASFCIAEKMDLGSPNNWNIAYDADLLGTIINQLDEQGCIDEQCRLYLNPTMWKRGNSWRFIEFDKNKHEYRYSQITDTPFITGLFDFLKDGATTPQVRAYMEHNGADVGECGSILQDFINESLVLPEYLYFVKDVFILGRIKTIIEGLDDCKNLKSFIRELQIGDVITNECVQRMNEELVLKAKKLLNKDLSRAITVDVKRNVLSGGVDNSLQKELKMFLKFYNMICIPQQKRLDNFIEFTNAFSDRYGENRLVPFMEALDPVLGLGYPTSQIFGVNLSLLEEIDFPTFTNTTNNFIVSEIERVILSKLCTTSKSEEIRLTEEDFSSRNNENHFYTPSFCVLTELFKDGIVYVKGVSNKTATMPLVRYQKSDSSAKRLIKQIIEEERLNAADDVLLADIVFESGTDLDNLMDREFLREGKIITLYDSTRQNKYSLKFSDLYLMVSNGRIRIWSPSIKKFIIPVNSSVYNYHLSDFSHYRFLSEYVDDPFECNQLHLNFLFRVLDFVPRIRYKQFILSPASWKISGTDLTVLETYVKSDTFENIMKWKDTKGLPQRMLFNQGDKSLLIDWENKESILALLRIVKKEGYHYVWLTEYLFDEFGSYTYDQDGNQLANETIFFCITNKRA